MERDLELNKDFFLGDNVDNEKIIRIKKDEKIQQNKSYSPKKVKFQNFLTNITQSFEEC